MRKNAPTPYRRLDKADRVAIERGPDERKSCGQMARELGRSPSTVADEVCPVSFFRTRMLEGPII